MRSSDQRREIGFVGRVHRRRHGDDEEIRRAQVVELVGVEDLRGGQVGVRHLVGAVVAGLQLGDACSVDVKTDDAALAAKGHGHRQAHISQADNGNLAVHGG